jgi:hypothetical protein
MFEHFEALMSMIIKPAVAIAQKKIWVIPLKELATLPTGNFVLVAFLYNLTPPIAPNAKSAAPNTKPHTMKPMIYELTINV